jgi:uncharacterized pyridoxal phosphate-containing UPF0001 family protein
LVLNTILGERSADFKKVNTSREPQKMGVAPEEAMPLVKHILENCKQLNFVGIMTIGSFEESNSNNNNEFEVKCKIWLSFYLTYYVAIGILEGSNLAGNWTR